MHIITNRKYQSIQNALRMLEQTEERYMQLIYAVETKNKGESRHETALRYIKERYIKEAKEPQ